MVVGEDSWVDPTRIGVAVAVSGALLLLVDDPVGGGRPRGWKFVSSSFQLGGAEGVDTSVAMTATLYSLYTSEGAEGKGDATRLLLMRMLPWVIPEVMSFGVILALGGRLWNNRIVVVASTSLMQQPLVNNLTVTM